jgi:hypothetical protein
VVGRIPYRGLLLLDPESKVEVPVAVLLPILLRFEHVLDLELAVLRGVGWLAGLLPAHRQRVQLARQLIITSDVAWRKHVWLQRSLGLFAIGTGLLVISFVAF